MRQFKWGRVELVGRRRREEARKARLKASDAGCSCWQPAAGGVQAWQKTQDAQQKKQKRWTHKRWGGMESEVCAERGGVEME